LKYFITSIAVFIFLTLIVNAFGVAQFNNESLNKSINDLFTGSFQSISFIGYFSCGSNWWDVFCNVGNGFIAFFNAIITIANSIWIFFQFIFKVANVIYNFFVAFGSFLSFFFSNPFTSFVAIILFLLMFYDILKFIRGQSY
jgi:hypothetical protein